MSELALGQIKGLSVNNNIVTVPSGHTLYAPGHIVQVVTFKLDNVFTTTSTSWIATNLLATITPKSVNSKIIVQASTNMYTGAANINGMATIFRGNASGVNLNNSTYGSGSMFSSAGAVAAQVLIEAIDTPNTLSPVTYTLAIMSVPSGTTVTNLNGTTGTMTLMEVAA